MATLVDLREAVSVETSVEGAVGTMCELLSKKLIDALDNDVEEARSIAEQLATNAKTLGRAVVENTTPTPSVSDNKATSTTRRS